jgi:hypothetical protein
MTQDEKDFLQLYNALNDVTRFTVRGLDQNQPKLIMDPVQALKRVHAIACAMVGLFYDKGAELEGRPGGEFIIKIGSPETGEGDPYDSKLYLKKGGHLSEEWKLETCTTREKAEAHVFETFAEAEIHVVYVRSQGIGTEAMVRGVPGWLSKFGASKEKQCGAEQ